MKSLGVRLAAGATTILLGAYAATLVQKDSTETTTDSWSAEAPSLGQPATPIAGGGDEINDDSWIDQPPSESGAPTKSAPGRVQLVQHTEEPTPSGGSPGSESPQTSFEFAAGPDESPATTETEPGQATADVPPVQWGLPAGADEDAAPPAQGEPPSMRGELSLPQGELALPNEAPEHHSDPTAAAPAALNPLPELAIRTGAAVDFGGDPEEPFPSDQAPATAMLGNPEDAGAPAANVLRGGPGDANLLRESNPPFDAQQFDAQQFEGQQFEGQAFEGQAFDPQSEASGFGAPTSDSVPGSGPQPYPGSPDPGAADSPYVPSGRASLDPTAATAQRDLAGEPGYPLAGFAPQTAAVALHSDVTTDAPGDRRLEGVQSPSVVIQKRAPAEVKVGTPATFVIHVQNVGAVEALDVEVHDKIPSGMRLIDASPTPVRQDNSLLWQLGAMPAGDERTVTMQLVPEQEGELGSVARVSFEAAASVRTISTRPELKIVQSAPETVLIGQQLEIELEVSNPGTGRATGVVLQEDVPEGLEHPKGRQLDNAIGDLEPGEVRRQVLRMRAVAPGVVQNTIRLTGDDGLTSEHTVAVQVVAPELQVELEGPSRRFLERQATYQLILANVGTADATNVELSVQLDRGFTFVSTGNQGQYDPSRHSVHWSLAQLPAGGTGRVPLTLLPVEEGSQAITMDARADLGVLARNERQLSVEGFSELSFSISNPGGPIELGSETTYEITISNRGSKADSNVQVQVQLPPGLELISSDGDAGTDGRGLVAFQPKSSLAPGSETSYRIRVRGVAPGTHIVKAIVVSDQASTPVTKEESTLVYADQ